MNSFLHCPISCCISLINLNKSWFRNSSKNNVFDPLDFVLHNFAFIVAAVGG